jgi:hypothetical protein
MNNNINGNDIDDTVNVATIHYQWKEYFYSKINEYYSLFESVHNDNDLGRVMIQKRIELYPGLGNKTYDEIKLETLSEIFKDTKSFIKKNDLAEQRKSYYCSTPVFQKIMANSLLLKQNNFCSRLFDKDSGESYLERIESLIRILGIYRNIISELEKKENSLISEATAILNLLEKIEKIYFKLLFLEYNELINFDHWWKIYINDMKNSANLFSSMLTNSLRFQSELFLKNKSREEICVTPEDLVKNLSEKNTRVPYYAREFNQHLGNALNKEKERAEQIIDFRGTKIENKKIYLIYFD